MYLEGQVDAGSRKEGRDGGRWAVGDGGGAETSSGSTGARPAGVSKLVLNSLSPNEFLLGYLHSKQEKEDQLWAEGARAHCKQWGLKGEGSPSEKR